MSIDMEKERKPEPCRLCHGAGHSGIPGAQCPACAGSGMAFWSDTRAALKAKSAAPAVQGVPEGWKLVPVEPTDEMIELVYEQEISPCESGYGFDEAARQLRTDYRAMLKFAPTPPAAQPAQPEQEPLSREALVDLIARDLLDRYGKPAVAEGDAPKEGERWLVKMPHASALTPHDIVQVGIASILLTPVSVRYLPEPTWYALADIQMVERIDAAMQRTGSKS